MAPPAPTRVIDPSGLLRETDPLGVINDGGDGGDGGSDGGGVGGGDGEGYGEG